MSVNDSKSNSGPSLRHFKSKSKATCSVRVADVYRRISNETIAGQWRGRVPHFGSHAASLRQEAIPHAIGRLASILAADPVCLCLIICCRHRHHTNIAASCLHACSRPRLGCRGDALRICTPNSRPPHHPRIFILPGHPKPLQFLSPHLICVLCFRLPPFQPCVGCLLRECSLLLRCVLCARRLLLHPNIACMLRAARPWIPSLNWTAMVCRCQRYTSPPNAPPPPCCRPLPAVCP